MSRVITLKEAREIALEAMRKAEAERYTEVRAILQEMDDNETRAESAERRLAIAVEAIEAASTCYCELANGGYENKSVYDCAADMNDILDKALREIEGDHA